MDARAEDQASLRADFYLCLARAFMVPDTREFFQAMRDDLAADLADLAEELGYDIGPELAEYQRRIQTVCDADELLQLYSRLFLQPPRAIHINTGVYLDGSFNGGSVVELEEWYRSCGLVRSSQFLDLSDHVSVQLECIAYLYTHALNAQEGNDGPVRTAGQFIGRFASRWVTPWCDDFIRAERELGLPDEPYHPLCLILQQAVRCDAEAMPDLNPANTRREKALALARHRQAGKGVTEDDMAEIRRKLEERGLTTDHLAVAPEMRDASRGWQRMTPPTPRK
jgi:TorA maturation chaperone TorD